MRAVVISQTGGPETLKISDIPVPEPGEGQVRIKVAYCALNPLDTHSRAGRIKWGVPPMPFTSGYEYSGRVEKLGPGVDASWMGKRVACASAWGGCADFALAPLKSLVQIPDAINWQLGTVYYTSTLTAWHLLHTLARMNPGDVVVVHSAAGAVGVMLTQVAKDIGGTVIGLVGSAEKAAFAKSFGCDHVIDEKADPEWPKKVKELTGGRGADIIADGNAGPGAPKNNQALAPMGQIIYLGAMAGPAPDINVSSLIAGSQGVRGFVMYHGMARTKGVEFKEVHDKLISGKWKFPLNPPLSLTDIAKAHDDFENRRTMGRTIFTIGGEV